MTWLAQSPTGVSLLDGAEVTTLHGNTVAKLEAMRLLLVTQAGYLDGLEGGIGAPADAAYTTGSGTMIALLKAMLASLNDTATAATITESGTQRIGTRAYGATQRIAVATASTSTGAVVTLPKGEVMVQADTDCFIQIGTGGSAATATATTSIPLVAGEKFHLQAPTGQFIAVIRKTADGFLYITPVA